MPPNPPTPQDSTARFWARYTSAGRQHEVMFRFGSGASISDATDVVHNICVSLAALMPPSDSFIGARYSAQGSTNSFPVPWDAIPGTGSDNVAAGDPESKFIDFVGRGSESGSQVHWTLFTPSATVPLPPTNRVQQGYSAPVDAARNAIAAAVSSGAGVPGVVTIKGDSPIVYTYANVGFSAYWQRKQRRGG